MYTMEDFQREAQQKMLDKLTPAQIGKAIPSNKLAEAFPVDSLFEAIRQKCSPAEIKRKFDLD